MNAPNTAVGDDESRHGECDELAMMFRRAGEAATPHLMAAGREMLLAVKAFVDELVEPDETARPGRMRIPVD